MKKKSQTKCPRILLVEDRAEDVKLFKIAINEICPMTEVVTFTIGRDLIRFLEETPVDAERAQVIFMDINLPGQNGLEYLAQVKQHPVWKEIPVVILTSSGALSDIRQAYKCYANSYIQKPMELGDFRESIKVIASYWLGVVTLSFPFSR